MCGDLKLPSDLREKGNKGPDRGVTCSLPAFSYAEPHPCLVLDAERSLVFGDEIFKL